MSSSTSQQGGDYTCQACGASFGSQQDLQQHNQQQHESRM
ncbi:C2H2-type zinc finger protein [Nitrososphaera sp.]